LAQALELEQTSYLLVVSVVPYTIDVTMKGKKKLLS
jgi:hypothetical protein